MCMFRHALHHFLDMSTFVRPCCCLWGRVLNRCVIYTLETLSLYLNICSFSSQSKTDTCRFAWSVWGIPIGGLCTAACPEGFAVTWHVQCEPSVGRFPFDRISWESYLATASVREEGRISMTVWTCVTGTFLLTWSVKEQKNPWLWRGPFVVIFPSLCNFSSLFDI